VDPCPWFLNCRHRPPWARPYAGRTRTPYGSSCGSRETTFLT
jgi:hypothetical protein